MFQLSKAECKLFIPAFWHNHANAFNSNVSARYLARQFFDSCPRKIKIKQLNRIIGDQAGIRIADGWMLEHPDVLPAALYKDDETAVQCVQRLLGFLKRCAKESQRFCLAVRQRDQLFKCRLA